MDWETPVDAWYVWLAVAMVSIALLGFVVGLPSQPPPDATQAVNTIDRVAASTHQASATYEHGADEIRIDTKQLLLRNDGGTAEASVAFGSLTPVHAVNDDHKREALQRISHGQQPAAVLRAYDFDSRALLDSASQTRRRIDRHGAEWRPTDGTLRVRKIEIAGETVVLLDT
jgi:hypothetical protein